MRTPGPALACCTALCLALAACASTPAPTVPTSVVDVTLPIEALPGARYAWVPMPPQRTEEKDSRVQDPELRARLRTALDSVLQSKGYRHVDDMRQADVLIAYRVGVRDVQQVQTRETGLESARETGVECRGGRCSQIVSQGPNGTATVRLDTVDTVEGGLLIEVLQPSDIRVLWRAFYRGTVRADRSGQVDLNGIASRTLSELPRAPAQ